MFYTHYSLDIVIFLVIRGYNIVTVMGILPAELYMRLPGELSPNE